MKNAALLQSLYDRLSTYTDLTDLVVGVYSKKPQDEDDSRFPYVVIGDFNGSPWDTDDTVGQQVLVQVHVFSRSTSDLQRLGITDEIYNALNRYDLQITGVNTVDCLYDNYLEFDDPDGKTTHGVVTFRVTYDGG